MKFKGLEGLRFLSSVAIVLFHFVPYLFPGQSAEAVWTGGFGIAVDLFFVISGIVIANGYFGKITTAASYGTFLRRRVARLLPLYWATLAFYVLLGLAALNGLIQVASLDKYNFAELVPNVLMVQAWGFSSELSFNYVSWSISAELFVYLIFPLIAAAMALRPGLALLLVAATLAAAIAISQTVLAQKLPGLTWNFSILRAIPSFAFGVWLFANRERLGSLSPNVYRVTFNVSGAVLLAATILHADSYVLLGLVYVVVASAFICDTKIIAILPSWTPLSDLGKLTYSVYMLHTVMATVLITFLFPRLFGHSFAATLAAIVTALAATFIAAALSYRFFEEPLRRRLSGHRSTPAVQGRLDERLGAIRRGHPASEAA